MGTGKNPLHCRRSQSVFGPHEMELPVDDIAKCFCVNKFLSLSVTSPQWWIQTITIWCHSWREANLLTNSATIISQHCFTVSWTIYQYAISTTLNLWLTCDSVGHVNCCTFPARKLMIRELHNAHSGLTKTLLMALHLYYWLTPRECDDTTPGCSLHCECYNSFILLWNYLNFWYVTH